MPNPAPRPLLRLPATLDRTGCGSRSAWYRWITAGLAPRPIRIGPNTSAWLASELDAVVTARTAGADDDAVRELVARLHAARQPSASAA